MSCRLGSKVVGGHVSAAFVRDPIRSVCEDHSGGRGWQVLEEHCLGARVCESLGRSLRGAAGDAGRRSLLGKEEVLTYWSRTGEGPERASVECSLLPGAGDVALTDAERGRLESVVPCVSNTSAARRRLLGRGWAGGVMWGRVRRPSGNWLFLDPGNTTVGSWRRSE